MTQYFHITKVNQLCTTMAFIPLKFKLIQYKESLIIFKNCFTHTRRFIQTIDIRHCLLKSKSIIHLHFNSLANTKTNQEKNQSRERAVQTPHTSNSAKNNHIKVDGTAKYFRFVQNCLGDLLKVNLIRNQEKN